MKDEWIFTFGWGQKLQGKCVRVRGTFEEARSKMIEKYGVKWSFQYSSKEWEEMKNDPTRGYAMEEEVPFE